MATQARHLREMGTNGRVPINEISGSAFVIQIWRGAGGGAGGGLVLEPSEVLVPTRKWEAVPLPIHLPKPVGAIDETAAIELLIEVLDAIARDDKKRRKEMGGYATRLRSLVKRDWAELGAAERGFWVKAVPVLEAALEPKRKS
ncbi:hypothetical protein CONLIGDRAFT_682683 [Coniochaeta ligniaria NRRL 30616]|uniref:Uncharacterized protein n=1 Tax=Coniochaeta ligniaria NRRL 30616 TaxID=1408157 RepID=A0A1J7IIZ3_9PEZI|nr:hypothetical protein CONLIGDRAFT_682683 [Coniochaeta ligniaria NRRL 30616]